MHTHCLVVVVVVVVVVAVAVWFAFGLTRVDMGNKPRFDFVNLFGSNAKLFGSTGGMFIDPHL